jgi:outer membrane lipoprotein
MHHHNKWWHGAGLVVLLSVVVGLGTGCVAVLSQQVRQSADRSLSLTQLRLSPADFIDRTVILGGDLLRTWNVTEETWFEILQKPLDSEDRPLRTEQSEGRFMVRCDRFFDPAVYAVGRSVTVAGRVLGTHTDKVGESDYVYPLLSCLEIYVWPQTPSVAVSPNVQLWWEWDPWYGDPWYWHHYHWHFRGRYYHHRHHRHYRHHRR